MTKEFVDDKGLVDFNLGVLAQCFADAYGTTLATKFGNGVKFDIGYANEENFNANSVGHKTYSSGLEVVKMGGSGIGGNATVFFAEGGGEAAKAMEAALETLREAGKLDDFLLGEIYAGQALKAVAAARFEAAADSFGEVDVKFAISWARESDLSQNTANDTEFNSGDFVVQVGGNGVGGNASAHFGTDGAAAAAQFDAFLDTLEALGQLEDFLTGKLAVDDTFDFISWNNLAGESGAKSTKDPVGSFGQDPAEDNIRIATFSNGDFVAQTGGAGAGGNAVAKFDAEADRDAFEFAAESLVDAGLANALFDIA